MLQVEQAVYLLLTANAGVSALVGTRVYGGVLEQSVEYPAVVYRISGSQHVESIDRPNGLRFTNFRIFSACRKQDGGYAMAKAVSEAVRIALEGYSGTVEDNASPPDTLPVQYIEGGSSADLFDDKTETFEVVSDYTVIAHEEVPTHS